LRVRRIVAYADGAATEHCEQRPTIDNKPARVTFTTFMMLSIVGCSVWILVTNLRRYLGTISAGGRA
jgi:hypothetical protein